MNIEQMVQAQRILGEEDYLRWLEMDGQLWLKGLKSDVSHEMLLFTKTIFRAMKTSVLMWNNETYNLAISTYRELLENGEEELVESMLRTYRHFIRTPFVIKKKIGGKVVIKPLDEIEFLKHLSDDGTFGSFLDVIEMFENNPLPPFVLEQLHGYVLEVFYEEEESDFLEDVYTLPIAHTLFH